MPSDALLADLAFQMAGDMFYIVPAQKHLLSIWREVQPIVLNTKGAKFLYLAGIFHFFAACFTLWALFFSPLEWYVALGSGALVYAFTHKIWKILARHALTSAASDSPKSFVQLWEIGAFAVAFVGRPNDFYDVNTSRWQDVILVCAGRVELVPQGIQPRQ
jgi:hypothetical protein